MYECVCCGQALFASRDQVRQRHRLAQLLAAGRREGDPHQTTAASSCTAPKCIAAAAALTWGISSRMDPPTDAAVLPQLGGAQAARLNPSISPLSLASSHLDGATHAIARAASRERADVPNGVLLRPTRLGGADHFRSDPGVHAGARLCVDPGIHSRDQIEGWRVITEAVHALGGLMFLQMWHVGRISHPALQPDGMLPIAPSAIRPAGEAFIENELGEGELVPFVTPRALENGGGSVIRRRVRARRPERHGSWLRRRGDSRRERLSARSVPEFEDQPTQHPKNASSAFARN